MKFTRSIVLFIILVLAACGAKQKGVSGSGSVNIPSKSIASNQRATVIVTATKTNSDELQSLTGFVVGPHHVLTLTAPRGFSASFEIKKDTKFALRVYDPDHNRVAKVVPARLFKKDPSTGLTLLKTEETLETRVKIRSDEAWNVGTELYSIDWVFLRALPSGDRVLPAVVRKGSVISTTRLEYMNISDTYFSDLPSDEKAAGAGVFNHNGDLIGIRWMELTFTNKDSKQKSILPTVILSGAHVAKFLDAAGVEYNGKPVDIFETEDKK